MARKAKKKTESSNAKRRHIVEKSEVTAHPCWSRAAFFIGPLFFVLALMATRLPVPGSIHESFVIPSPPESARAETAAVDYDFALKWCRNAMGAQLGAQFDRMVDKLKISPNDSNVLTTLGNLIVSTVEGHMRTAPAKAIATETDTRPRILKVVVDYLFQRAIRQDRHFGALYSRALVLKLYPSLLGRQDMMEASFQANKDMCDSQEETLKSARIDGRKKVPALLADQLNSCTGSRISLISDWSSHEVERMVTLIPIEQPQCDSNESAGKGGNETIIHLAYIRKRAEERPLVVQGMDAIIHDIPLFTSPKTGSAQAKLFDCHIYQTHCYAALWRQFERQQLTANHQHFPKLASVAHFSGGQFYHWLADGLPRLVAFCETFREMHKSMEPLPLLLPSIRGGSTFIEESLKILELHYSKSDSWPFSSMIYHNMHVPISTDELILIHWTAPDASDFLLHPASSILTPPSLLRRVRDVYSNHQSSNDTSLRYLIFVSRKSSESRWLENEDEVEDTLRGAAKKAGLLYTKFDGSEIGIDGALKLFPYAKLVVGAHGAGLTNAIFCRSSAILLELSLPEPEFEEYQYIAGALGLLYGSIPLGMGKFESRVYVHPPLLSGAVHDLLGNERKIFPPRGGSFTGVDLKGTQLYI